MRRAVLLGMNNPYGSGPEYALYPLPERSSGWRLWRLLADIDPSITMTEYRDGFKRLNLVAGKWTTAKALTGAERLRPRLVGRVVAPLGRKVWHALGLDPVPFLDRVERDGTTYLSLPHPSGLNLWYNEPANRAAAGNLLKDLLKSGTLHPR